MPFFIVFFFSSNYYSMAEASTPEDPWATVCILCEKPLAGTQKQTAKEKGIKIFIKSSKFRGEKRVEDGLLNKTEVEVHSTCAKTYNSKHNIKYNTLKTTAEPSTSRRSTNVEFDYKNNCIFCGELLNPYNKAASTVSYVTSITTRAKLLKRYANFKNAKAKEFVNRVSLVPCLVEVGACYHKKCMRHPPFDDNREKTKQKQDVITTIINYIQTCPEESQFCLSEILVENNEMPMLRTLKYKLQEHFESEFIIQIIKENIIISRMSLARVLLAQNFHNNRLQITEQEQLKKVEESSAICLKEIKNMKYDIESYPPQDKFLNGSDELVPKSLYRYLFNIIAKNKSKPHDWNKKINSIAHAIIASTRPTSFVSPVQVNLACVIHRMFASKELVDSINANGFCASYFEVRKYLSSVICHEEEYDYKNAFTQLVYDNADHNVETCDGRNTFHVMGGIQIITPSSAISESRRIKRLKNPLTTEELAQRGKIDLQTFKKTKEGGFKNVKFENVHQLHEIPNEVKVSELDFMWLSSRALVDKENFSGYHWFMEKITKNDQFDKSKIKILPFINAPASDLSTIYTALYEAEKLRNKVGQFYMFVTFDSPLFWKGQEIETHVDLERIILRLGGFHLWFSFTSSIYYIMNGSGLRELFCEMYAENSCDKVLNGTAYTRSVRAHLLMHAALGTLIIESCNFTTQEKEIMNSITSKEGPQLREYLKNIHFQSAYKKFNDKLEQLETRGPTAKLWVLYFKLLTIMKLFIEAERTGNFLLHLESCQRMLPIFYATGHFHYAKCLILYLIQMIKLYQRLEHLEQKNDRSEIEEKEYIELYRFITLGYFTIRRTNKFWSGVWTDMVIEQSLMRLMKSRGGITHGRGVTESVQTQWTLSTPAMADMSEQLQTYSKVHFTSSEQHKDSRPTRMKKDFHDYCITLKFFRKNNPFPYAAVPISLSTGIMGDESINCHESFEIGKQLMLEQSCSTRTFGEIKFSKKNKCYRCKQQLGKSLWITMMSLRRTQL